MNKILIFGVIALSALILNYCEHVDRATPTADLADNEFSCESCHISETMLKMLAPEAEAGGGGGG